MSNEYNKIIRKSIEQYRQKMIHLYLEMDSDNDDFEKTLQIHIATFIQAIRKVVPLPTLNKWVEKISHINMHGDYHKSHIEVIRNQNQQYIDDIFDDIFDDAFFNLGDDLEMDNILSVNNVIQNIFNIDILHDTTSVADDLSYALPENIDKYLEQFNSNEEQIQETQEIEL